jgi:hypothetical protein
LAIMLVTCYVVYVAWFLIVDPDNVVYLVVLATGALVVPSAALKLINSGRPE